jgi:isoleucyl-tRNA synthetase
MNDASDTPAAPASARDYRQTVFLPRTDFPMRADLPKREPALLAQWEAGDAWAKLRAASKGRPPFVLHDGPPYANGPLHIGHALNKILKDVVNRAAQMAGHDADYVPGWDCHGLPIEWKVEEEYRNPKGKHQGGLKKEEVPVLDFRAECRAYAQKWLDVQREEFKRLGVAGDWARRYATMDFASEAAIVGEIGRFLLNGSLYRGLRPVMWSPVEKTALAEAEIEYADHVSHTLWARFPVAGVGRQGGVGDLVGASLVAWTTTPWTIPANRALAVNPKLEYAVVHVGEAAPGSGLRVGERLVVALKLLPDFAKASRLGAHVLERVLPAPSWSAAGAAIPSAASSSTASCTRRGGRCCGGFRHRRGGDRRGAHRPGSRRGRLRARARERAAAAGQPERRRHLCRADDRHGGAARLPGACAGV